MGRRPRGRSSPRGAGVRRPAAAALALGVLATLPATAGAKAPRGRPGPSAPGSAEAARASAALRDQPGRRGGGAGPRVSRCPRTRPDAGGAGAPAPAGRPFVLRLHRFFWSDGEAGSSASSPWPGRYTRAGYLVELQLRYHPRARAGGRHRRLGPRTCATSSAASAPTARVGDPGDQRGEPDLLARLLRRRLRGRARRADPGRDRGQGRGAAARLSPARDRLQLGLPHRPGERGAFWDYLRDHGGRRSCRARLGRARRLPGTVLPARRGARAANATGWSTR